MGILSSLSAARRYRPPFAADVATPPFIDPQLDDFRGNPMDADFSGRDTTGPATELDDAPEDVTPSLSKGAMDKGAGKLPPPMIGGPSPKETPPPAILSDEMQDDAPPVDVVASPPTAPKPMAGGPHSRAEDALSRYESVALPKAPEAPRSTMGKIGSGVLDVLASKAGVDRHPIYARQLAEAKRQKDDAATEIKLADDVDRIASNREYRKGLIDDRAEARSAGRKNAAQAEADRQFKFSIDLAQMGGKAAKEGDPIAPGATRLMNPTDPTGATFVDIIPTKGTRKVEDADLARALKVAPGTEVDQALYVKGVDLLGELERARIAAGSKPEKSLNPQDILLHPGDFDPETVKTARGLFDQMHQQPGASDAGTWTLAEDSNGNVVEHNSKTGEVRNPKGDVQRSGVKEKRDAAKEKAEAPARDALAYANTYLGGGNFTGSGDFALQDKFFQLAKPDSGFRMSDSQMKKLADSRSWMQSIEGKAYHAATGRWFTDKQREEIVTTMRTLQAVKGPAGGKTKDPLGIR